MQIVDIARLGKLGGIQKVAAKLLGHVRIVLAKMLRCLNGMLVKVGHIHIGDLRLDLDRSHQQDARARRSVGPRKRADGANQRHGATGDIGSCHVKDRLAIVSSQHNNDRIQRLMSLEQHRKRANAVEVSVQMAHIVAYRRAAVEAFLNHMPAIAQITLRHAAPTHILRIAHRSAIAHTSRIIAIGVAVTKAQNIFHRKLPTQ